MNKTCRLILFAIVWDTFHFFFTYFTKIIRKTYRKTTIRLIVLIVLSAASDLGVSIDEHLCWKDQCKIVEGKVKGSPSTLQRLKDSLPQSKLAAVYRALIESHLSYGNIIWGGISDSRLDTLQKLQSRAKN